MESLHKKYSTTFCILIIVLLTACKNDIDYEKIRPEILKFSCAQFDSSTVNSTLKNLLEIDTARISNGLYLYYNDLGMTYQGMAAINGQKAYNDLAISCYNKCVTIDKNNGESYYHLCLIYFLNQQHEMAKKYVEPYKKYTEQKSWDTTLINMVEKHN